MTVTPDTTTKGQRMEAGITDSARIAMVRAAVAKVDRSELKTALDLTADPRFQAPKAVANALNALRKHRDPAGVVTRPQYRAALPFVAAAIADACLTRTIEVLGDHSEDPTREQLLDALDQVRGSFDDSTIAVMLASVADDDMPASDLCFEIVADDPRFGLTEASDAAPAVPERPKAPTARQGVSPEQREARRLKKQRDAEERRKKMEAARKAGEQVRRERKKERTTPVAVCPQGDSGHQHGPACHPAGHADTAPGRGVRPARLTGRQRRLRLGAVRLWGPRAVRARGRVAPVRGRGRIADRPVGPTGILRGREQEPGLEVGAPSGVEAGRIRPADVDRRRSPSGPPRGGAGSGRPSRAGGLELPLVARADR